MHVAPTPGLAALEGGDDRVTGRIEMPKRMRMLRILAASDMAAGETYAKLVPLHPERETLLAAARARRYLPNLTYVFATLGC